MAYVLSSVSGNLISAASAGFAPTNSADVSAIASSYQVVSATGTQTYAGTAYVTSVNEAPLSAARAGNAANAVLATSAWYDGTGRLLSSLPDEATVSSIASAYQVVSSVGTSQNGPKSIVTGINELYISARYADTANEARKDGSGRTISSLPDSAAVSAIASSYAESAASSKLDATASSQFLTAVPDGYATTEYVDSSISGFAYESAVSGWTAKQDALTFGYNAADQISSIDGSALGGMDEAAVSAIASAYAESAASSKQDTLTFGYDAEDKISSIDGSAIAGGNEIVTSLETASSLAITGGGLLVPATSVTGINGFGLSASAATYANSADNWYSAYTKLDASASSKFVQTANIETQYGYVTAIKGSGLMGCDTAVFINSGSSFGFADANTPTALPDGTHTVTASKSIFTTPTITVREVGQLTGKTVYPASMAATARITGISALNPPLEIVSTTDISFTAAYANYESAQLAHASALPTYQYDAEDKISSINGSAIAGGSAGVDSATCSAIASAYAESAVSGKADSSALSSYVPYSSLEYNTASAISGINGSALAAGSTYSAGEGIDITDDVISVETPVDIVAGPGIVIDNPDGNTLRVSVDQAIEVTLYEDSTGATSVTLSESYYNFERVRFTYLFVTNFLECTVPTQSGVSSLWLGNTMYRAGDGNPLQIIGIPVSISNSGLTATITTGRAWWYPGNAGGTINALKLVKVVGIHRLANN